MDSAHTALLTELKRALGDLAGQDLAEAGLETTFLELGFDSLFLTQASALLKARFGVKVSFRQLIEEFTTLGALVRHLDQHMPLERRPPSAATAPQPDPSAVPPPLVQAPVAAAPPATVAAREPTGQSRGLTSTVLERIMNEQLRVMEQQLALLRGSTPSSKAFAGAFAGTPVEMTTAQAATDPVATPALAETGAPFAAVGELEPAPAQHGPFRQPDRRPKGGLTEGQQEYLDRFITRYVARTTRSKAHTQRYRGCFADPRVVAGFKPEWKEMVYPIVSSRSAGAYLWDLDGNRWVDVTMGFGVGLLGHSPPFITEAVRAQLERGVEIGPQSVVAGEVAELICDMTGMDRVTFCNTGSEAVMAALRICRTVTGRTKVVLFGGAYHGTFDEVLVRGATVRGEPKTLAIAPGIAPNLISEVVVLEYGTAASLEWIRAHADELAAVLVEVVQSRHPDLQPREFLRELRQITEAAETPLIFDEVITGFRCHPGGAQAYFGIRADLATYGKVIGGGMPLGFVAGRRELMDTFDGGTWQYGDDSFPSAGVTFFAGTFVRHPLAMAAAKAMLRHLKAEGPQLQAGLGARTERMLGELNRYFERHEVPVHLERFTSLWYPHFGPEMKWGSLLYSHLREKGVHIWEGRPCFLSTAHSPEDEEFIIRAFKQSVAEMQAGGFLPGTSDPEYVEAIQRTGAGADFQSEAEGKEDQSFPMSEAQREMWLGAQMRPEAAGPHHACTGLWLEGPLEILHLRRALRLLIERHEGLRSTFNADGTEIIVHPAGQVEWLVVEDLSGLPESERDARVDAALQEEGRRLLDLERGPLVSFRLLTVGPERHLLIFTAQMIVCDGWSHYVVFEDLAAAYSAFVTGAEPSLKPPVPMREFAHWQHAHAATEEAQECEAFWLAQFREVPPVLNLPTARPRPPTRTFEASRCSITLDGELCQGIRRVAREQQNSYFALLLAAFQVWLHRLSDCRDLVVGVPFAAQGPLGMERFVGQCANTLPLRTPIVPEETFAEFLARTWSRVLDAQEHWDFTFGQLASKLDLPRDPSRIPLVSVLFNLDPPMSKVRFSGLKHRFFTGPRYYYQYDLGFNLVEDEGTVRVECDYNVNLFNADWVRAWTAGYETLLRAIVRDVNQALGRLPMMTAEEARQWVLSGADHEPEAQVECGLHGLVAAQAMGAPEAIAAESDGAALSYGELERQAGRIAERLRERGIGMGSRVGVCMERSVRLPVALLGVLKAGAAYVPLNPALPADWLSGIVIDSGMELLVVDASTDAGLTSSTVRRVGIEELLDGRARSTHGEVSPPAARVGSDDLAMVIYSPGSNGMPQGVEISHGSIVNLLRSMQCAPGFGPQDVMLGLSPISSARFGLEMWLPLVVSARVVIVPQTTVEDPTLLAEAIEHHGITVMQATPSIWRLLLQSGWAGCGRLRAWSGGEALQLDLADRLLPLCGELWNLYGAAETTIWSMTSRVQRGTPISLGKPIAGTAVRIVDERFEPVPVGVPGEIMISGAGLARGYLGQPDLTSRKFMASPLSPDQGERMYRTGDLARYNVDGRIEFLGRPDGRVEIGGFRIELSEIEAAMARHEAIREAVVIVREDTPGEKLLVGYAIPEREGLDVDALRNFLRERLPDYLVPDQLVALDRFPLTPNQKIDRKQLPRPDAKPPGPDEHRRNSRVAFVAPRTATEKALADIWAQVLGIEHPGIHDNFFDLGGQSMLAMRAVMLAGRMGIALKPRFIFLHQTIAELAAVLDQAATGPIAQGGSAGNPTGTVPLTPAQIRFLLERETCDPHHWNCSSLVRAQQIEANAVRQAVKALLAHHDALRLRLSNENGEWSQCVGEVTDDVPFETYDLAALEPDAQRERIQTACAELQASLDLARGPVLRVAHFDCGPGQADRLFFALHHFVVDELSWEVFWEDFESAYQQGLAGGVIQLPRKTTSVREWSIRLKELTTSAEVQGTISQWLALPWEEVGHLPLDYAALPNANTNASADFCELLFSAEESSRILRPEGEGRPEEVMLAALARTLGHWSDSPVALIDFLSHGRGIVEDANLSRTVGFMLCYQPVLVRAGDGSDSESALPAMVDQIRRLPPGFTFDLLRFFSEAEDVRKSFAKLPHSEVLFNFTGPELEGEPVGGSAFCRCNDPCGTDHSPRNGRYYPLAISGAIVGDRLRFRFVYSKNLHKRKTIERLATRYRRSLLDIVRPRSEMKVALR